MPTFDIGAYRIEVLDHARFIKRAGVLVRADILGRPRLNMRDGDVLEQFDVRALYQNAPLAWGSYGPESDFPDEPHREIIEWYGREVVDTASGTTRGADFRNNFFPSLMYQLRKARAARDLGKTITEVKDTDIVDGRDAFAEPVNIRTATLDAAVETLVGRRIR